MSNAEATEKTFYAVYEDGTQSNSIHGIEEAVRWLEYYRARHPGKLISIVDEDGYIVPGAELFGRQ